MKILTDREYEALRQNQMTPSVRAVYDAAMAYCTAKESRVLASGCYRRLRRAWAYIIRGNGERLQSGKVPGEAA